ncbi:Maf family protein [Geochorda subterranea]|uniref:dTTP/UTP pyrophosphatase n=1 Tax=Geochorda subterranea TaxID=3109564 RepID=A0ABZ1BL89_9FIRM|nr:Maf family protein [Limnochorda sp. LNt]WRP13584.1 Maf family protein [Limnochorda sp. LNt]
MTLVLASTSPRRRRLLAMLGTRFELETPAVDESSFDDMAPPDRLVMRLAEAKARDVATRRPDDVVIGADTVVVLDGQILGKPRDREEARRMLTRLSGRTHQVWTGVAVVHLAAGRAAVEAERTDVTFRPLSPDEVERYVQLGEGMDKAGAYAVQGVGAVFVERLEGCYYNVVGLPLARLHRMLEGFGLSSW